jgi:hypothetical protein
VRVAERHEIEFADGALLDYRAEFLVRVEFEPTIEENAFFAFQQYRAAPYFSSGA